MTRASAYPRYPALHACRKYSQEALDKSPWTMGATNAKSLREVESILRFVASLSLTTLTVSPTTLTEVNAPSIHSLYSADSRRPCEACQVVTASRLGRRWINFRHALAPRWREPCGCSLVPSTSELSAMLQTEALATVARGFLVRTAGAFIAVLALDRRRCHDRPLTRSLYPDSAYSPSLRHKTQRQISVSRISASPLGSLALAECRRDLTNGPKVVNMAS